MRLFICTLLTVSTLAISPGAFARGGSGGSSSGSGSNPSSHAVSGYVRDNGTYVAPSHATNPNETQRDNYSTRDNLNPYTGNVGTRPVNH